MFLYATSVIFSFFFFYQNVAGIDLSNSTTHIQIALIANTHNCIMSPLHQIAGPWVYPLIPRPRRGDSLLFYIYFTLLTIVIPYIIRVHTAYYTDLNKKKLFSTPSWLHLLIFYWNKLTLKYTLVIQTSRWLPLLMNLLV